MSKTIVITGSTRGIGLGLADAFLALGCSVVVSGRLQESVDKPCVDLSAKYEASRVYGLACNVTDERQVQRLWEAAKAHFSKIDIWINNAGIAHPQADFWTLPPEEIRAVVSTNILGTMYGSRVALRGMLEQGYGGLYNMEGFGADKRQTMKGMVLYGTTKASIHYLTSSLMKETEGTAVIVGAIRPGMVATDMLSSQYSSRPEDWERSKRILNILADPVSTVAPWVVEKILTNQKNGVVFTRSGSAKIMGRFLLAPFRKRDLFV
jgi:NAD(P)-dependent dehydrogenase (short-subunit alcohol dehydrogenase family)